MQRDDAVFGGSGGVEIGDPAHEHPIEGEGDLGAAADDAVVVPPAFF